MTEAQARPLQLLAFNRTIKELKSQGSGIVVTVSGF